MATPQSLAAATLDAIPMQLAVLDAEGRIVSTNSEWCTFGEENGLEGDASLLGEDYVAACEAGDDEYATTAAAGLTAVLDGERSTFAFEYPCHGPDERRWFTMRAHRFQFEDEDYVLVAHLDITERRQAERAVERANEALQRERDALDDLLARVDGLVTAVTQAVVRSRTRDDVEAAVCSALAAVPSYAGAWIGRTDPSTSRLTPAAAAGRVDAGQLDVPGDPDATVTAADGGKQASGGIRTGRVVDLDRSNSAHVSATALDERELCAADDLDDTAIDADPVLPPDARPESVAAIPIVHEDVPYGVVTVYGDAAALASENERHVLSTLGDVVATAIHVREAQAHLDVELVWTLDVALEDPELSVARIARAGGTTVRYCGSTVTDDGETAATFAIETPDGDEIDRQTLLEAAPDDARIVAERPDEVVLERLADTGLVGELLDRNVVVRSVVADADGTELRVDCPDQATAQAVFERLEQTYEGVDLRGFRERADDVATPHDVRERLRESLTDRQWEVLWTAYVGGFYERPRESTGEELATAMGITRPTFHQHRVAAERKVLAELFGE